MPLRYGPLMHRDCNLLETIPAQKGRKGERRGESTRWSSLLGCVVFGVWIGQRFSQRSLGFPISFFRNGQRRASQPGGGLPCRQERPFTSLRALLLWAWPA